MGFNSVFKGLNIESRNSVLFKVPHILVPVFHSYLGHFRTAPGNGGLLIFRVHIQVECRSQYAHKTSTWSLRMTWLRGQIQGINWTSGVGVGRPAYVQASVYRTDPLLLPRGVYCRTAPICRIWQYHMSGGTKRNSGGIQSCCIWLRATGYRIFLTLWGNHVKYFYLSS